MDTKPDLSGQPSRLLYQQSVVASEGGRFAGAALRMPDV